MDTTDSTHEVPFRQRYENSIFVSSLRSYTAFVLKLTEFSFQ